MLTSTLSFEVVIAQTLIICGHTTCTHYNLALSEQKSSMWVVVL